MGMKQMFGNATFDNLFEAQKGKEKEKLQVSEVVHKAYIEVNEKGAEGESTITILSIK
jgi:serine protease inhibitor